jgi:hypothetical protein
MCRLTFLAWAGVIAGTTTNAVAQMAATENRIANLLMDLS